MGGLPAALEGLLVPISPLPTDGNFPIFFLSFSLFSRFSPSPEGNVAISCGPGTHQLLPAPLVAQLWMSPWNTGKQIIYNLTQMQELIPNSTACGDLCASDLFISQL